MYRVVDVLSAEVSDMGDIIGFEFPVADLNAPRARIFFGQRSGRIGQTFLQGGFAGRSVAHQDEFGFVDGAEAFLFLPLEITPDGFPALFDDFHGRVGEGVAG